MASKPCEMCGKPFDYTRAHARFCGELCRKRHTRSLGTLVSLSQERINQHIDAIVKRAMERGEICPPVYGRKGVT